ncbi:Pr6Pr family membrane protein [Planococcus maritimus]|uniref:Pr6Pr family membrane protein n=1 Tax=Planococcus maritimus TaxID=192421 RepID=UPI003138D7EA
MKPSKAARLLAGAIGLVAIIVQMQHGLRFNDLVLSNFFSYFTIQSNIIIVAVFLAGAVISSERFRTRRFQLLRGAATTYIMTTGIVYFFFLRGLEAELQTTIPWVNFVLHTALPIYALIDWWLVSTDIRVAFRRMGLWILYPVAYLVYTLLRGLVVSWYPYPFLDPGNGGYAQVAISSLMITLLIVLCGVIVVGSRKWVAGRQLSAEVK